MHKRILTYASALILIAALLVGWWQRDTIYDSWRLHNYQAPAEVAKLADSTTMNDKARRLFYVYRPNLEDKATFNSHCSNTEQTIVLGCYVEHQGIYLYNVSDDRLNGIIEVTAAHELLHAAYDRLSSADRAKVDILTAQVADTIIDERLKSTIENYRKKDAGVVPNELHSILATEVRNLPDELEQYYKRYFNNRAAIVDLADTYKGAFTERESQVRDLDQQLTKLKEQIDEINTSLEAQQTALKTMYDDMQQKRKSSEVEAYNAAVPTYNKAVVAYNASVNRQKQLVNDYNSLVEQRNNLATEENELIQALDSRSTIQQE